MIKALRIVGSRREPQDESCRIRRQCQWRRSSVVRTTCAINLFNSSNGGRNEERHQLPARVGDWRHLRSWEAQSERRAKRAAERSEAATSRRARSPVACGQPPETLVCRFKVESWGGRRDSYRQRKNGNDCGGMGAAITLEMNDGNVRAAPLSFSAALSSKLCGRKRKARSVRLLRSLPLSAVRCSS
jgi:hypothetical protein